MIVFPPESPSSKISVIEKLSFQLIKLEIWQLLLSHLIHPLSLSPIFSTFEMFQISTILPIPSITSRLTWILTSSPTLCIFFQFILHTDTKIMYLSHFFYLFPNQQLLMVVLLLTGQSWHFSDCLEDSLALFCLYILNLTMLPNLSLLEPNFMLILSPSGHAIRWTYPKLVHLLKSSPLFQEFFHSCSHLH